MLMTNVYFVGVQSADKMLQAMTRAAELDMAIVAHLKQSREAGKSNIGSRMAVNGHVMILWNPLSCCLVKRVFA